MDLVRVSFEAGRADLIRSVLEGAEPGAPLEALIHRYAAAALAEGEGDLDRAAADFAAAGDGWHERGYVLNHALCLIGGGRCLLALERRDAGVEALRTARAVLERLEARPLLGAVDALLAAPAVA
jgi:hypothetical protein